MVGMNEAPSTFMLTRIGANLLNGQREAPQNGFVIDLMLFQISHMNSFSLFLDLKKEKKKPDKKKTAFILKLLISKDLFQLP